MTLWTPTQTTTQIWLDASDSSTLYNATSGGSLVAADGAVARIEDKSGNARHLTQATGANRPLRKTSIQNSLDILRFDGSNDFMENLFVSWGVSYAVFAVVSGTNAASGSGGVFASRSNSTGAPVALQIGFTGGNSAFVVRDDSSTIAQSTISGLASNTWYLFGGVRSSGDCTAYRNGTAGTTVSAALGTITANRTSLGAYYAGTATPTTFLSGDVGEVIVAPIVDRQKIEGYLAWKWGLQSNLPIDHPYKNAAPTIGRARHKINDGLFNRGLFNAGLAR